MKNLSRNPNFCWSRLQSGLFRILGLIFILLCIGTPTQAQEVSDVEHALQQLHDALKKDDSLDPAVRDALSGLVNALKAERDTTSPQSPQTTTTITPEQVAPAVDEYLERKNEDNRNDTPLLKDRLNISGDLRLRHESNVRQDTSRDRHRGRIRFRVGGTYTLTDQLIFGARIITGDPDDPKSSNQTMGNVFDSYDISLDRAYVAYVPQWAPDSLVTAGKFEYPLKRNPVFGELVWDGDVQPEGIAFSHTKNMDGRLKQLHFVTGQIYVEERSNTKDATLFMAQGSARLGLTNDLSAELALGYFSYSNIEADGTPGFSSTDNGGNALIDTIGDMIPDSFASDFEIVNPLLSITYGGWKMPLTLSAEYIKNLGAEIDEDEGFAVGAALGKTNDKGDWRIYYQYQVVEQDSVFAAVSQDEFLLETNFKGHMFGSQYQLSKKIQLHLWALASERDKPDVTLGQTDQTQWRLRGDVVIKF